MKDVINRLFLFTCALLLVPGCSNMESRWESAKTADSVQIYDEFLRDYPDSTYRSEALERKQTAAERTQYQDALQKDEIAYYERFKSEHKQSHYSEEVQQKLDAKIRYIKGLPEITAVKIAKKEGAQDSPVDDVLFQTLRDLFTAYGFAVKSNDDPQFDVLLSIGGVGLFIPAGTLMDFTLTADANGRQKLEGRSPTKAAVRLQFDVYHSRGGALLLGEEIRVLDVSPDPEDPETLNKISTLAKQTAETTVSCMRKYANVKKE